MTKRRKVPPQSPNVRPPVSPQQGSSEVEEKANDVDLEVKPKLSSPIVALQLVVPAVMLLMFLYLWFGPTVALNDPWWDAAELLNSASGMSDPAQRNATIQKAGAELKRLSELHPYHARVRYMLAYYYLHTGQLDPAITEGKEAVRLGSGGIVNQVDGDARSVLVEATLKKAQTQIDKQDFNAAYQILHDSYPLANHDKDLLLALGNVCSQRNDNNCAVEYFQAALKVDPNNAQLYLVLGNIAKSQGQVAKAIEYLEKAVALDPKLSEAQNTLAELKSSARGGN
jgi:tetratricopeptide (TPR) repeat protein